MKKLLLIIVFVLTACATSPMGRPQLVLLPDSELDKMGAQAFTQLKQKEPVLKDPQKASYVQCIVDAILQANGINGSWEVEIFNEPKTINAFAMPGKKIGVYTGILKIANTPGKLAAGFGARNWARAGQACQRAHVSTNDRQSWIASGWQFCQSPTCGFTGIGVWRRYWRHFTIFQSP